MAEERSQAPHHCSVKMHPYGSGQEQNAKHVIVKKIYVEVPYNKIRLVWEFVAASVEPASNIIALMMMTLTPSFNYLMKAKVRIANQGLDTFQCSSI